MENYQSHISKIQAALDALPQSSDDLFIFDNFQLFPNLLKELLSFKQEIYNQKRLGKYQIEERASFPTLIIELIDGLTPLNTWLSENEDLYLGINNYIDEIALKGKADIENTKKNIQEFKRKNSNLEHEKKHLESIKVELTKEEERNTNLINNKNTLNRRIQFLRDLEQQVKEGKLIELEKENNQLNESLKLEESKFNTLKIERDCLLKKQLTQQDHIQKIINQTRLIGNTDELFKGFEEKCKAHNEEMLKNQLEEVERIKGEIEIYSDKDVYSGNIISSIEEKLTQIKNLLEEVNTKIRANM